MLMLYLCLCVCVNTAIRAPSSLLSPARPARRSVAKYHTSCPRCVTRCEPKKKSGSAQAVCRTTTSYVCVFLHGRTIHEPYVREGLS